MMTTTNSRRRHRAYVPGGNLLGAVSDGDACLGCLHHPSRACAACGSSAVVALDAGPCAMPLCVRCFGIVREWRAERQAKQRQKQPVKSKRAAARQARMKGAA